MTTPGLSPPIDVPARSSSFPIILLAWGALATVITLGGALDVERRLAVPAVLVSSLLAMIAAYRRRGPFHAWARSLPLTAILALQALRAPIGMAFLLWAVKGVAPVGFASGAGYGDLAVGVLATGLLALGARVAEHPRLLGIWNALGLLDILAVVVGAQVRFLVLDPSSLRGLLTTWFPILPLFFVPLVIAAHLLVIDRLRSQPADGSVTCA